MAFSFWPFSSITDKLHMKAFKSNHLQTWENIPEGSFWWSVATLFHPYLTNRAALAGLNAESEEIVRKKRGYNSRFCKTGDVDA